MNECALRNSTNRILILTTVRQWTSAPKPMQPVAAVIWVFASFGFKIHVPCDEPVPSIACHRGRHPMPTLFDRTSIA